MGKRRLPDLPETGRRYVEHTIRARLASPGIERYEPRRRASALPAVVVLLAAAAGVAAYLFFLR
jgi:hypothetical protein